MKCDPVVITRFLNGELEQAEMEETLAHLDTCRCCLATFKDLLAVRTMAPEIRSGLAPASFQAAAAGDFNRRWLLRYGGLAAALLLLVGGLYVARGFLPQAGPSWRDLLETEAFTYVGPVTRSPAAPVDPAREAIMALYVEGQYPEFVQQATGWLRGHPDDRQVIFFTGVASYLRGQYPVAATYLEWAAESGSPVPPEVQWYRAHTYLRQTLPSKARPLLQTLAASTHPYARRAQDLLDRLGQ